MSANNSTAMVGDMEDIGRYSNIATLVIGILGIITNGTLLVITLSDPLKCFQRSSVYFIVSLAFSDFFTSVTCCIFALREAISTSKVFNLILPTPIWASVQNSFITIFMMAVERLIVIRNPLKARSVITKQRTKKCIAVSWFVSVILGGAVGLPNPMYRSYAMFGFMIECLVLVVAMLFIYVGFLVLLRDSLNVFQEGNPRGNSRRHRRKGRYIRQQSDLNAVVFCLTAILFITVLPHIILGIIYLSNPGGDKSYAMKIAPYITFPWELLNFTLNPIVYAWRLREYQLAFRFYLKRGRNTLGRVSRHSSATQNVPLYATQRFTCSGENPKD